MGTPFLIDGVRIRQLASTRQGRVSLGGFAYQMGYAIARLASLYTRRPILDIDSFPTLLRFDWAEDLDEVDVRGRAVFTQCKRISDIGQPGTLADVLLGFAPKWLWAPEDQRPDLRFRLVCTDSRFAGLGPTTLSSYRLKPGESDETTVLAAAVARLEDSPGPKSDRALWQPEAGGIGFSQLCNALWNQTEVLYLSGEPHGDDPAGPLLRAEQEVLARLVRMQIVVPSRQRPALAALRTLLHGNLIEFDPNGTRLIPTIDREPQVIGYDDVHYALFEFQRPAEERSPFQLVTRQILEEAAKEPKHSFVARPPRWADVVHGQDEEIRFLEREMTSQFIDRIRDELLGRLGEGEVLPMLFVLGAPGAGKSTLVRRVAARLVLQGLAVVAAPKLNLDSIEPDEFEPFFQSLARLEEGSLPVLLVLDDPFFADSGWVDLLRRLAKKSQRIAVLGASPEYLFREFGYPLTTGRQIDCRTLTLPRPQRMERRSLAELHGRDPDRFEEREEDFLVLAMEASAGVSFEKIIDRVWMTLNSGRPIEPRLRPEDLPWTVRAYLVACYFHRFYVACPEVLMQAALSQPGRDQPPGEFAYELRRLVDEQGWSIFRIAEPRSGERFLGVRIGAAHARVAAEAWRRRPVPAFDVGEWVLQSSLDARAAAVEIGTLAVKLEENRGQDETAFIERLITLWNQAAEAGTLEANSLSLLRSALSKSASSSARKLRAGLQKCIARADEQSWLAALELIRDSRSHTDIVTQVGPFANLIELIRVADFHLAPSRAGQLLNRLRDDPVSYEAFVVRVKETADHPRAYQLLASLIAENPDDEGTRERATDWIEANLNHPQVYVAPRPVGGIETRGRSSPTACHRLDRSQLE